MTTAMNIRRMLTEMGGDSWKYDPNTNKQLLTAEERIKRELFIKNHIF